MTTTKPPRRGRPPLGPGRGADGVWLRTRVSVAQYEVVREHCAAHDYTVSELIRARLSDLLGADEPENPQG